VQSPPHRSSKCLLVVAAAAIPTPRVCRCCHSPGAHIARNQRTAAAPSSTLGAQYICSLGGKLGFGLDRGTLYPLTIASSDLHFSRHPGCTFTGAPGAAGINASCVFSLLLAPNLWVAAGFTTISSIQVLLLICQDSNKATTISHHTSLVCCQEGAQVREVVALPSLPMNLEPSRPACCLAFSFAGTRPPASHPGHATHQPYDNLLPSTRP
jgi:hypothetical protein